MPPASWAHCCLPHRPSCFFLGNTGPASCLSAPEQSRVLRGKKEKRQHERVLILPHYELSSSKKATPAAQKRVKLGGDQWGRPGKGDGASDDLQEMRLEESRGRWGNSWRLNHAQIWDLGGLGTQLAWSPSDRAHGKHLSVVGVARDEEGFEKLGPPAKCSEQSLLNKNQPWYQKYMKNRAFHTAPGNRI